MATMSWGERRQQVPPCMGGIRKLVQAEREWSGAALKCNKVDAVGDDVSLLEHVLDDHGKTIV